MDDLPPLPANLDWELPTSRNLEALRKRTESSKAGSDSEHRSLHTTSKRRPARDDGSDDYGRRRPDGSDDGSVATADDGKEGRNGDGADKAAADKENADETTTPKKPRKPRPKLDAERLLGQNGILKLHRAVGKATFRGKGHEQADLAKLMRIYSDWAHELFPRYTFRDFAAATERVAASKRMRLHLLRWRSDPTNVTMLSDEFLADADLADANAPVPVEVGEGAEASL